MPIVIRTENDYEESVTTEDDEFATIQVPAGMPASLQNILVRS